MPAHYSDAFIYSWQAHLMGFAILLLWNMVSQNMIIRANKDEDLKPAAQERMMEGI